MYGTHLDKNSCIPDSNSNLQADSEILMADSSRGHSSQGSQEATEGQAESNST